MPDGLVAAGLVKRFDDVLAVDGLSLEVHPGEVLGLLGPNGAGKTTAIRILCGLLAPDSGTVHLGDRLLASTRRARQRVGWCPQEVVVWDRLTCVEQLEYVGALYDLPITVTRPRALGLLAELGLSEKARALAGALSGGMRRRLSLALGLMHDPEFVVLDEPEAGLDPISRVRVREFVRAMAGRRTVIVTTHAMDEADRMADRIGIIDHGRLLALDTPAVLKESVGAGDMVEIEVARPPRTLTVPFVVHGERVEVRSLNAVRLVPQLVAELTAAGCDPGAIRLRPNSLEDVFLALTGREAAP